jgi:hypothetical protein
MLLAETPALPREHDRAGQPIGAGNLERTVVLTTGFLIGAGETTQGAVTRSLEYLLRPGNERLLEAAVAAARAGDDALVARHVWEALRFNPVNQFLPRVAKRDYTLDYAGVKRVIRAGTLVLAATQSAMFDESFVRDARSFVVDEARRPFTLNDEADVYYHLGVASHRCLGDRLSLYQVPQIVKALLLKPGLRRAAGDLGRIDNLDAEQGGFPERFYVEFDAPEDVTPSRVQLGDPRTAFEDYLNDYDRGEFLACLDTTGKTLDFPVATDSAIFGGSERSLLWCRLNRAFRECVVQQSKSPSGFPLNRVDDASVGTRHRAAKDACRTRGLTETDDTFYEHVMLGGPAPDLAQVDLRQATSPRAYEFEATLKFYNRAQYRDRLRNRSPLGTLLVHGRDPGKDLLYARLPLEFRECLEGFGADVKRFDRCQDGQTDPVTGVSHGGLTPLEKTYFTSYFVNSK